MALANQEASSFQATVEGGPRLQATSLTANSQSTLLTNSTILIQGVPLQREVASQIPILISVGNHLEVC